MYSSVRLKDRVQNVREKGITISRVLVAVNVGCDDTGTCYVSDEKRRGVHWALMAIDLQKNVTYYGDSLGWSLPNNLLDTVESNLKQLEGDLGIDIRFSSQNIVTINTPSPNSDPNKLLYPLQTCSDMCGVIVVCMCAVLCDHWNLWCENKVYTPLLQYPSTNSMQLRLMALSWIVNDGVDTCNLVQKMTTNDSGKINPIDTPSSTCTNTKPILNPPAHVHDDSDDDFMPVTVNKTTKHSSATLNDSSDDEFMKEKVGRPLILSMLPTGYVYKMVTVTHFKDLGSFNCELKIKLNTEKSVRKWVAEYNESTKETMVYDCCKNLSGKRVVKKLYLRCQHKQRQTGKHTKSNKTLKTTHKQHRNKNTGCPAQMIITILPPTTRDGFCVALTLKHIHNHLIDVADALRFRPLSNSTKEKYYDLFRQGHSPSSAHLEYESQVTYMDTQLLADRQVNPKRSDVYNLFNKWRRSNLGVRTGKQLFSELEQRINIYNDHNKDAGGKAKIHRLCKGSKLKTVMKANNH